MKVQQLCDSGYGFLTYRDSVGKFHAFFVPTWNRTVLLPASSWGQHEYQCKNFGPEFIDGEILDSSVIKCHDKDSPPWGKVHWQWDSKGKNLHGDVPDMIKVRADVINNQLVVHSS